MNTKSSNIGIMAWFAGALALILVVISIGTNAQTPVPAPAPVINAPPKLTPSAEFMAGFDKGVAYAMRAYYIQSENPKIVELPTLKAEARKLFYQIEVDQPTQP